MVSFASYCAFKDSRIFLINWKTCVPHSGTIKFKNTSDYFFGCDHRICPKAQIFAFFGHHAWSVLRNLAHNLHICGVHTQTDILSPPRTPKGAPSGFLRTWIPLTFDQLVSRIQHEGAIFETSKLGPYLELVPSPKHSTWKWIVGRLNSFSGMAQPGRCYCY